MKNEIITLIKRNRISTTEVADCLGKKGLFSNAQPLNRLHFTVGEVHYAYIDNESNWNMHRCIKDVAEGTIVLIDDLGANDKASFGELVAKYLILYKQVSGVVTNTKVRDAHALIKENYPIWCAGVSPIGCDNIEPVSSISNSLLNERKEYYNGSIMVCDDSGVVVIDKSNINNDFYKKLISIEDLEDKWFDELDRMKKNTFEIVCKDDDGS